MKKLLTLLAIALLSAIPAHAEIIGEVLTTDIVAFIDNSPIKSYNHNDHTYITAEDLRNYGFNVKWNAPERRLDIFRHERSFSPYIDDFVNEPKQDKLFTHAFDVYSTDIKTYINGELVPAVNIDGQTLIALTALDVFGECVYNDNNRECYINILNKEIEGCETKVAEEDASIGYKVTEQGFFDENGRLLYGIKHSSMTTKYGERISEISGNFEQGKTLEHKLSETDMPAEQFIYTTPQLQCLAKYADGSRYNMYVTQKKRADGKVYAYLSENGALYCEADANGTVTTLYKNGSVIATENITTDTLAIFGEEYSVLYAPGYTDADGIIYYAPANDINGGCIFYRGEVVNGVAHGSGTAYMAIPSEPSNEEYYISQPETAANYGRRFSKINPAVIYTGGFADGLPHGSGDIYSYGEIKYSGGIENGKMSGFGSEYSDWSEDSGYLLYEGEFADGLRSGYGREYGMTFDGVWLAFDGNWSNGSYESGKWYSFNNDTLQPELYYEGEFRYGDNERQYGTAYKYYNEETGEYEVKTGYFVNWEYVGE